MTSRSGNPDIEDAAIAFVIELERLNGRNARDSRGQGAGDVESDGRIIEVKAYGGRWVSGLLYFTPPQILQGEQNDDYYVYIVDNVAQGDPSKFEARALHGDDLRRLFAGAKVHRLYVPVRAADKARLTRLDSVRIELPLRRDSTPLADHDATAPDQVTPPRPTGTRVSPLRERDLRCMEFFGSIMEEAKLRKPDLTGASRVRPRTFFYFAAGRVGFLFGILFTGDGFHVELYINPRPREFNKALFDALHERKAEIEDAIGSPLAWERLDNREGSRVVARRPGATINDSMTSLDELRAWAVPMLVRFAEGFRPMLGDLADDR